MILKYITSFGAQTLYNGTTHQAREVTFVPAAVDAQIIQLPGGAIFDPFGSFPLTKMPDKVKYKMLLVYATETALSQQVSAISALIGTKATLTGQKPDGVNATCSARLIEINDESGEAYTLKHRKLTLTFQTYGVFA